MVTIPIKGGGHYTFCGRDLKGSPELWFYTLSAEFIVLM